MAHSRINRNAMFDWIEQCVDAGRSTPDDAAICARFDFTSTESARTLLAELADAGRISIKGYGATRTIKLGRGSVAVPTPVRPQSAPKRADAQADADAEKILAIAKRGRASAATSAGKLLATAASQPAAKPAPAPKREEPMAMPGKSIMLPASSVAAIAAVEAHARREDVSLGVAAATLIERGCASDSAPVTAQSSPPTFDDLLDMLRERFAEQEQASVDAAISDATGRAEAAERRATDAEGRATTAEERLARMKELLA